MQRVHRLGIGMIPQEMNMDKERAIIQSATMNFSMWNVFVWKWSQRLKVDKEASLFWNSGESWRCEFFEHCGLLPWKLDFFMLSGSRTLILTTDNTQNSKTKGTWMPNSKFETTMLIVFDVGGIIIFEYASTTKSDSKPTVLLSSVSKITRRD